MSMAAMPDVAGSLWLRPGAPLPHNLRSTRRDWAAQLAPGRPAAAWPALLASLYNQCGHAHRLCSRLALAAATRSGPLPDAAQAAEQLRAETAREHQHRIALDWPRALGGHAAGLPAARAALVESPLRQGQAPDWEAQRRWLAAQLLQMPAEAWLQRWQSGGADWLAHWCHRHEGWLARLLAQAHALDLPVPLAPDHALQPPTPAEAPALARALAQQAGFALQPRWPQWQGRAAHTGTWSRAGERRGLHGAPAPVPPGALGSPWALLGFRLADLVRLSLPDGAHWLACGAQATGPRAALAWVETGRGLLLHHLQLADLEADAEIGAGAPRTPVLRAAQVLPPTAWNFHAEGIAARILARIDAQAPTATRAVGLLTASLDPCMPLHLAPPSEPSTEPRPDGASGAAHA